MLTKMQNPVLNYISRLLALPLLTLVFVAFTVKTKQLLPGQNEMPAIKAEQPITVVIDAGHGGDDAGARSRDGLLEKNIGLEIALSVKKLNTNPNVNIILTRDQDVTISVRDKLNFAVGQNPDALIAIHINAAPPNIKEDRSGIEIYLSNKRVAYSKESHLLASLIGQEIQPTYGSLPTVKMRESPKGIWMLDAPTIAFPALIIECGYITNKKDLLFISNKENQEKIAKNILRAIERFASIKEDGITPLEGTIHYSQDTLHPKERHPFTSNINVSANKDWKPVSDTLPANIKSVDMTKDNQVIIIYKNNTAEKITKAEAVRRGVISPDKGALGLGLDHGKSFIPDSVLCFIDGNEVSKYELEKISPNEIETINVLKDKTATGKYGERAKNGVIEIILKKRNTAAGRDIIFEQAEEAPRFPGGDTAWTKYISKSINKVIDSLQTENKSGTCLVQFIVDTEGNLSGVKPLTMEGTFFAKTVTDAIRNGPKWIPAMQNGHKVSAYHKVPVTFQISGE